MTSKELLAFKKNVRARDGYCCTECGLTNEESLRRHGASLEIHRVIPGSDYTMNGCITLCKICHSHKPRQPVRRRIVRPPSVSVAIRLPIDHYARIEAEAAELGLSPQDYIQMIVARQLQRGPAPTSP